ncbi:MULTISPECIES: glycyl-radical enzyme activating protein [Flavobacteriaceae]|uniref:Glycyl-radical enzyme activating protein n=2 Tax=Flavobacteriaceae TaxID=49546 RepID=A0A4Y8AV54_9FLAO|nr:MULTISPECIES: glycyl-radical enzyme activating protein [Flavobacteriaceae]TEW75250.1 glycyl-radical enzyme activating protein [Gramella jeungdoensis]GGK43627.1 glycyl-radical enzyme activating protein [Lutibacter litoralis]
MSTGLIFDIKRYAINDGPGIRLTVFFKGCNVSCQWCHNPESMSPKVQKMYNAKKCIGALSCIENCPNDALKMTSEGIITDYNVCNLCGICAEVCPTKAFEMLGSTILVSDLMQKIDNEAIFFDKSGGGVTFSGGEPLMHAAYLLEALKECGKRLYHRVVDTTAFASVETILEVAQHTELFLIDLKVMDSKKHKEYTGVSNEKILSNIVELAKTNCEIIFRIPLIKNVNTSDENIIETANFINSLEGNRKVINLLPYHNIAENKHIKLGTPTNNHVFEAPNNREINAIIDIFGNYGITATIGG